MLIQFLNTFLGYSKEVLPFLFMGFLISGLVHEFISAEWIQKHLGRKGISSIFYATLIGTILPICCIGSLPVAISFYKKGAKLGPILAFLVATPATSIPALLITYKLLGAYFTIFLFFSVILLGLIIGLVGNLFPQTPQKESEICENCGSNKKIRIKSVFRFAFWQMPKEIGLEILLGLALAALVVSITPVGELIKVYLSGLGGYIFAVIFGLIMYICATASVPFVHALVSQGINIGAALTLLLLGPITSYSSLLVLRKTFGFKILLVYLTIICTIALFVGYIFSLNWF
ncbi:MAG: permease [Candidatus Nealsonbacteria bacterium]